MEATDLKLYAINISSLMISMTNIDQSLKIVLLLVTIGYTIHKWMELVNKKKNK
jgi:hypothetical protein